MPYRTVVTLAALFLATPVLASNVYDGPWNVTVSTQAGSCPPAAQYMIRVDDGMVSGPAEISGKVTAQGIVRASIGGAFANGQLQTSSGAGKWNSASAGIACSGRWAATKQ